MNTIALVDYILAAGFRNCCLLGNEYRTAIARTVFKLTRITHQRAASYPMCTLLHLTTYATCLLHKLSTTSGGLG